MTIEELYAKIGGNYQHALTIMRMDRLIDRHIRKLGASGVAEALVAAGETMDAQQLFESAHGMKGVCANLGLDDMAEAAHVITEEFRPGNPRTMSDDEVRAKIAAVNEQFQRTVEGIHQYEAEA